MLDVRLPLAIGLCIGTAALGFVAGIASERRSPSAASTSTAEDGAPVARGERGRTRFDDEDPRVQRERRREVGDVDEIAVAPPGGGATGEGASPEEANAEAAVDDPSEVGERGASRREIPSDAESCVELLGKPIEPREHVHSRFSGPSLSRSVSQAIEQAGVPGDVEGVDCSEFPCIVFARLAGDEEDIEEIERSAALDAYEGDVLTLLLWATTMDESARTHPTAKETGLFALAYYDWDDRAEMGEELDRRIRARVLEVWNAERPGRGDAL